MSSIMDNVYIARGVTKEQLVPKRTEYNWQGMNDLAERVAQDLLVGDLRMGILYDPDVDGLMSGFILKEYFNAIGIKDVSIHMNRNKVHGFKEEAKDWVRDNNLNYVFIVDAGSGDSDVMSAMSEEMDITFIVLDHHDYEPTDTYGDVTILNACEHESIKSISGCGVVYLFIEQLSKYHEQDVKRFEKYVGITILSDVCSMIDAQNRYFVKQAYSAIGQSSSGPLFSGTLSRKITFWGSWSSYMSFSLIPFLNAMIRCNYIDEVLELSKHFERNSLYTEIKRYENIKAIQKEKEDEIIACSELVQLPGLSLLIRPQQNESYQPFNGVVANRYMRDLHTNMLVLEYNPDKNQFEGSYRGLDIGKTELSKWGLIMQGHEMACGAILSYEVMENLLTKFEHKVTIKQVVDFKVNSSAFSQEEYETFAFFNEYTGKDLEKITIELLDEPTGVEHKNSMDKLFFQNITVIDFAKTERIDKNKYVVEPVKDTRGVQFILR